MKDVYLRAAELVDSTEQDLSCCAISVAKFGEKYNKGFGHWRCAERTEYQSLFSPELRSSEWSPWGFEWGRNNRDCRVLALLFMHWIQQSEEKK